MAEVSRHAEQRYWLVRVQVVLARQASCSLPYLMWLRSLYATHMVALADALVNHASNSKGMHPKCIRMHFVSLFGCGPAVTHLAMTDVQSMSVPAVSAHVHALLWMLLHAERMQSVPVAAELPISNMRFLTLHDLAETGTYVHQLKSTLLRHLVTRPLTYTSNRVTKQYVVLSFSPCLHCACHTALQ